MTHLKTIKSGKHVAYTYRDKGQWWFIIKTLKGKTLMKSTAPSKKQLEINVDFYLKALDKEPFVK